MMTKRYIYYMELALLVKISMKEYIQDRIKYYETFFRVNSITIIDDLNIILDMIDRTEDSEKNKVKKFLKEKWVKWYWLLKEEKALSVAKSLWYE